MKNVKGCVHFVGFRGEEYLTAVRVFGKPDFYHRVNDNRMREEVNPEVDTVVFANGFENRKSKYVYNDSDFM